MRTALPWMPVKVRRRGDGGQRVLRERVRSMPRRAQALQVDEEALGNRAPRSRRLAARAFRDADAVIKPLRARSRSSHPRPRLARPPRPTERSAGRSPKSSGLFAGESVENRETDAGRLRAVPGSATGCLPERRAEMRAGRATPEMQEIAAILKTVVCVFMPHTVRGGRARWIAKTFTSFRAKEDSSSRGVERSDSSVRISEWQRRSADKQSRFFVFYTHFILENNNAHFSELDSAANVRDAVPYDSELSKKKKRTIRGCVTYPSLVSSLLTPPRAPCTPARGRTGT